MAKVNIHNVKYDSRGTSFPQGFDPSMQKGLHDAAPAFKESSPRDYKVYNADYGANGFVDIVASEKAKATRKRDKF